MDFLPDWETLASWGDARWKHVFSRLAVRVMLNEVFQSMQATGFHHSPRLQNLPLQRTLEQLQAVYLDFQVHGDLLQWETVDQVADPFPLSCVELPAPTDGIYQEQQVAHEKVEGLMVEAS